MDAAPNPAQRPGSEVEQDLRRTPAQTLPARLARVVLALSGWRVEVPWPPPAKAVIAVYPHTSNWDFLIGILARAAIGLPLSWIGKDTIFRWPFGALFRRLGGIPVDRSRHHGIVAQMEAEFARRPCLWVVIAPEGTRAHTEHWKSGFYRLACAAGVPLGLGYLDYRRRIVGIGDWIRLSGNPDADLARLRLFYADKTALRPAQAGEIRFRE
jgi:1-acyl-sn-glycerol-3-phosphate acyltransferase